MNNKGADQTARMLRLVSAFVVRKPPKTGFLATRPIWYFISNMRPAKAKAWLRIEPSVADPERVQLRQNYFIFTENFQKNLRKLVNNQVKLTNRTPLYKFEPPIKITNGASMGLKKNCVFQVTRQCLIYLPL